MTPLDFILQKLDGRRLGWKDPEEQRIADLLCDLLKEVARTRARYYSAPSDGDGINSWRDQTRMLESDMLDWLIPFAISRFSDPRCTDEMEIKTRLASRLELYRSLSQEVDAA